MIKYNKNWVKLTCDKCGSSSNVPKGVHNQVFYAEGWRMNNKGRKYIHLCRECLRKNKRKNRLQPSYLQ